MRLPERDGFMGTAVNGLAWQCVAVAHASVPHLPPCASAGGGEGGMRWEVVRRRRGRCRGHIVDPNPTPHTPHQLGCPPAAPLWSGQSGVGVMEHGGCTSRSVSLSLSDLFCLQLSACPTARTLLSATCLISFR